MVCASLRTCLDQISLLGYQRRAFGRCISDDGPLAHILSVLDASFQWLWPRRGHQERIMRAEVQQEAFVCLELDGLCELEDLSQSDLVVGLSTSCVGALHFR